MRVCWCEGGGDACKFSPNILQCLSFESYIHTHTHVYTKCESNLELTHLVRQKTMRFTHAYTYPYLYSVYFECRLQFLLHKNRLLCMKAARTYTHTHIYLLVHYLRVLPFAIAVGGDKRSALCCAFPFAFFLRFCTSSCIRWSGLWFYLLLLSMGRAQSGDLLRECKFMLKEEIER